MSYVPSADFLALLRQTSGGMRVERMPGLDFVVAALARMNMFLVSVSQTEPTTNKARTVWVQPASPNSWASEAFIFIYNTVTAQYEPASPTLWAGLLGGGASSQVIQDVTTPGPVAIGIDSGIVRVMQIVSAPITLVMPESSLKNGNVLVSDWKGDAGANNITVQMSGADKLPGNNTSWTIAADCGSLLFRPVPGGYVI